MSIEHILQIEMFHHLDISQSSPGGGKKNKEPCNIYVSLWKPGKEEMKSNLFVALKLQA